MLFERLAAIDIVVGIPSKNEEDTIPYVAQQVERGLTTYFSDKNTLIVNIDNSDNDATKKAFLSQPLTTNKLHIPATSLNMGKGGNVRLLLELADKFNIPLIIMVDADLKSITPEWIHDLATPLTRGYDLVTPLYSRHHLDGTITNNIVYPLVYGLIGKDLRQPIGGDFSFSLRLARHWLRQEWKDTTYRFGIDNFMTITALLEGFPTCQVSLGAKIHKPSAPKLNVMFTEVVNTLFSLITEKSYALEETQLTSITTFGDKNDPPQELSINTETLMTSMMDHWKASRSFIQHVLAPARFKELDEGFAQQKPYINDTLWAELVYTLLAYYARNKDEHVRLRVVEALKPLYFARVLSYAKETENMTEEQAEALIKHQARIFWEHRDYYFQLLKHPTTHTIS